MEGEKVLYLKSDVSQNKNNVSFGAKPIPSAVVKKIERRLLTANSIDVYSHSSPDEDTINSAKVVYNWLKRMGKDVSLCFNAGETNGLLFKNSKKYKFKDDLSKKPDLNLLIDFNSTERVPKRFVDVLGAGKTKNIIGLDHHDVSEKTMFDPKSYIDSDAQSCSGVIFRFFEGLGVKLKKTDLESLYCGMLSDYRKSKLISIENSSNGSALQKLPKLYENEYSAEVLEKIETLLSSKSKAKILKHLDTFANLTQKEINFSNGLNDKVQITKNGKLAYVVIDPKSKEWKALGMDNTRTSDILANFRSMVIDSSEQNKNFSPELKNKLKDVEGAMVFYRSMDNKESSYKMSIHSKGDYAKRLIDYVKININPELIAGGHPDRAGGKVRNCDKKSVDKFINDFLIAAEKIN